MYLKVFDGVLDIAGLLWKPCVGRWLSAIWQAFWKTPRKPSRKPEHELPLGVFSVFYENWTHRISYCVKELRIFPQVVGSLNSCKLKNDISCYLSTNLIMYNLLSFYALSPQKEMTRLYLWPALITSYFLFSSVHSGTSSPKVQLLCSQPQTRSGGP